uniref:hypothetical protein n=1 Tax=Paractinoplanes polyasparticus TaxID=2856853 RepID=UPI001C847E9D|nr:hypothetical protein [Actinoplanes polyasparticus]
MTTTVQPGQLWVSPSGTVLLYVLETSGDMAHVKDVLGPHVGATHWRTVGELVGWDLAGVQAQPIHVLAAATRAWRHGNCTDAELSRVVDDFESNPANLRP